MSSSAAATTEVPATSKPGAKSARPKRPGGPGLFGLLKPYRKQVFQLIVLAVVANVANLFIPRLIADGIDSQVAGEFALGNVLPGFLGVAFLAFVFTALQNVLQTIVSERVAFDLREKLATKISGQGYQFIEDRNPAKLLTNLTSDIDSVKLFISQVIVTLVTSAVVILGTSAILISIDWELAAVVLLVIPGIGGSFYVMFSKVRPFFMQSRAVIDTLNKVIRENVVGAALIRVLNSGRQEHDKFAAANAQGRDIGFKIVRLFSFMIPIITFVAGMGTLTVVALGGWFVINDDMSLGSFAAFMNYLVLLIFPMLMIGFMSGIIAQATASYARISEVLVAPDAALPLGAVDRQLQGAISVHDVSLAYAGKPVLKHVSLTVAPGSRTAILGPTAAGKTQLLNLMAGLTPLQEGRLEYDGVPIADYVPSAFYPQVGLVFQDSVLFNTTMRENIAFSSEASDESLRTAIATAELSDFIASLPQGLDTNISERGTSLSGGQKQRIMLARALAQNPRLLFLDDFTARVDARTEQQILANIARNYPHITLVSITQKIAPITGYDQIILLMEGEILASGSHEELLHSSPEYVQIHNSQRSTSSYELRV
jgi:ATP-binding cassette subfamily B protein